MLAWFTAIPESDLFVSAVTLGEIQRGIELTRDQNPVKAQEITRWADRLAAIHNILPMDAQTLRAWAQLMHHQSDGIRCRAMIELQQGIGQHTGGVATPL